ncbi:PucR-like helix-turn-helix protein [Motilibacter peucedani]|uniref:PucR-like helix-turn-helix protein n=2 Tax=Motilibacter peucedani TaxID=598650 RepID=A0A420XQN0_9ACTN|nr:PucR-like helix-turn-helix protein [Motilibacter peucedani]
MDPDAEASLRVIEYFDRLVNNGVSLEALTRAAAALACCTAGLRDAASGQIIRFDDKGGSAPPLELPVAIEAPVVVGEVTVGHVWLERQQVQPLDEILVERMAVTAAARWRPLTSTAGSTDVALVGLLIAADTDEDERARALRLLRLSPARSLRVAAVSASDGELGPAIASVVASVSALGGVARAARVGMVGAVVLQAPGDPLELLRCAPAAAGAERPARIHVGVGPCVPASRAQDSWTSARVAGQFAGAWRDERLVVWDDLGALATLASCPAEVALSNPDVRALAEMSRTSSGELDIDILLAFTWSGSARQAAAELHLHHSSITNRLRHVEAALGVSVDDPAGRLRAQTAAILWRLHGLRKAA